MLKSLPINAKIFPAFQVELFKPSRFGVEMILARNPGEHLARRRHFQAL